MSEDEEAQSRTQAGRGPLDSARSIIESVLGLTAKRFELAAIELQEEKCRTIDQLLRLAIVVVCALVSLLMLSFFVVVLCWETAARLYVIVGLALLYAITAWRVYVSLRQKLENNPTPFSATVEELRKDVEWFQKKS